MSTPTTTNTAASAADQAIAVAMNAIVSTAETAIIAANPWLGWPGISIIWETIFAWVVGYFSRAVETAVIFEVIDTQVASEEAGMSSALAALLAAEKSGDSNAVKVAIANYAAVQSALINANGSSTPTS